MSNDDMIGNASTIQGMHEPDERPTDQNLDKQLTRASVMAGLFQHLVEPTRIGRFSLIKRIGAGGMGEVYAAYDAELDRKVAIKLVPPDADHGASQRLLREAQVLARLSHPNVVHVYEAGTVGERVFLAMEFIRGQTLRQWLEHEDEAREPGRWRSVLAMFLAAGRGLEAAHAAGLVHRDFKPDNVLIGDDGRVCVADFGLARVEAGSAASVQSSIPPEHITPGPTPRPTDTITRSGAQMGTPAYMSPEQWCGDASDARSDQFSFCVALYEALYRVHPFPAKSWVQLRGRVLTGEWNKPPEGTAVPARIFTILQRGLAVKPAERYPGMGTLLDALAVDPRQRWRRRTAVVMLLAAGGLIGGGVALRAASQPPKDPCALAGAPVAAIWSPETSTSARKAFLATSVPYAQALWDILQPRIDDYAVSLQAARKASCTATYVHHEQSQELFDLRTLCLDRRERHLQALAEQLARADMATVERGADVVAALPRIAGCDDGEGLVLGLKPPADAEREQVRAVQDELARASMLELSGHRTQALEHVLLQLRATEALDYQPVRAEALHQAGVLRRDGGAKDDVARAEELLKQALDLAESLRHDELVTRVWLDLVLLARRHHADLTLAHEWARRALATSKRLRDPSLQRRQWSAALSLQGAIHARQGDLALAEERQREALQLLAGLPDAPPLERARRLQELANTVLARGRIAEARDAFDEALTISIAELGNHHPYIARLSRDMALALRESGDFDHARELLERALEIWTAVNGPVSLDVADTHLSLANLEDTGDLDVAGEHARLGREIYGKVLAANSPRHAYAESAVALVALRRGQFAEALAAYERALAAHQRAASPNPVSLVVVHCAIGEVLVALGRPDEALVHIAEAEDLLAKIGDVLPPYAAGPLKSRGLALLAKGDARAAIAPLERALALLSPGSGSAGHPLERAEVEWALARALRDVGHDERARALARSARALFHSRGQAGESVTKAIDAWLQATP